MEVEKAQEQQLSAKYGGMLRKPNLLLRVRHAHHHYRHSLRVPRVLSRFRRKPTLVCVLASREGFCLGMMAKPPALPHVVEPRPREPEPEPEWSHFTIMPRAAVPGPPIVRRAGASRAPCVAAQHNSRQHFDSADWAMSKVSSSASGEGVPAGSRCQAPAEALPSPLVASGAAAASAAGADRLPSRFQRSPGADRTLSRLSQS